VTCSRCGRVGTYDPCPHCDNLGTFIEDSVSLMRAYAEATQMTFGFRQDRI